MSTDDLTLDLLADTFAICRLPEDEPVPKWVSTGEFVSVTRTADELSIVCLQANVPEGIRCERDWRCLKVLGPLDFSLTGILASLLRPLAQAGISVFAVATFDTDYLLVKATSLEQAITALAAAGHRVRGKRR